MWLLRIALFAFGIIVAEANAQSGTTRCPATPATLSNGQALADGWEVWIEGADTASVDAWANGLAFFLPMVSGSAAATELQCVARQPAAAGVVVTVEARKALDGRYRCSFAKGVFTCAR
jgi:hypothetical protein